MSVSKYHAKTCGSMTNSDCEICAAVVEGGVKHKDGSIHGQYYVWVEIHGDYDDEYDNEYDRWVAIAEDGHGLRRSVAYCVNCGALLYFDKEGQPQAIKAEHKKPIDTG